MVSLCMSGTMRMPRRAHAESITTLPVWPRAPAWMALTDRDGQRHMRR